MKKFVVLFICALMGMLSIPHISLWNLPVGTGTVNADVSLGRTYGRDSDLPTAESSSSRCDTKYEYRCVKALNIFSNTYSYSVSKCWSNEPKWRGDMPPFEDTLYGCRSYCSEHYGSECREPYLDLWATSDGTYLVTGPFSVWAKANPNLYVTEIGSVSIHWSINGNGQYTKTSTMNSIEKAFSVGSDGIKAGDIIDYWSDLTITDGTYVRNPTTGTQRFTFSGTAANPTPSTGTPSTGTPGQTSNSNSECQTDADCTNPTPATCGDDGYRFVPSSPGTCVDGINGLKVCQYMNVNTEKCTNGCQVGQCVGGASTPETAETDVTQMTTVQTNSKTSFTFNLPASDSGASSVSFLVAGPTTQPGPSAACINQMCGVDMNGLIPGSYKVTANAKVGTQPKILNLVPNTFTVNPYSGSPGTPGTGTGSGHCCVTKPSDTSRTYLTNIPDKTACSEQGGDFFTSSCDAIQDTICSQYCSGSSFGSGGRCTNLGASNGNSFQGVCNVASTPCVCTGAVSNTNMPCRDICNTDTRVVSVVQNGYAAQQFIMADCECSNGNPNAFSSFVMTPTASSTAVQRPPRQLDNAGQHGCTAPQACWATFFSMSTATVTNPTSPTLPGTQTAGSWTHPSDITATAPRATPNDHTCTSNNATVIASLSTATATGSMVRMIQAGDTVTINGTVTRMSETCKGYKYTCVKMSNKIPCESHNYVAYTSLDYKACPSDLPEQVGHEGKTTSVNWKLAAAAGLFAASFISAGTLSPTLISFLHGMRASMGVQSLTAATENLNCNAGSRSSTATAVTQGTNFAFMLAQCAGGNTIKQIAAGAAGGAAAGAASGSIDCSKFATSMECIDSRCSWDTPNMQCVSSSSNPAVAGAACTADSQCGNGLACIANSVSLSSCICATGSRPGTCTGGFECGGQQTPPTGPCPNGQSWTCVNNHWACWGANNNPTASNPTTCASCVAQGKKWCELSRVFSASGVSSCTDLTTACGNPSQYKEITTAGGCSAAGAATAKPTFDVTGDVTNPAPAITGNAIGNCNFNPTQLTSMGVWMALNQLPACPSADDYASCFSVCGKTYETQAGAAPTCQNGGPIIGYTDATYPCTYAPCGGFASKQVKIDIRAPDGTAVMSPVFTTTDANGDFSYTFQVPAGDGEFTAIVSVPSNV